MAQLNATPDPETINRMRRPARSTSTHASIVTNT
jgi:hypothetical protein